MSARTRHRKLPRPRLRVVVLLAVVAVGIILLGGALDTLLQARIGEAEFPPGGLFLRLDGTSIHYIDRGAGRPVVMLHGNPGFLTDFSALVPRLEEDARVVALDRPGHGYSARPHAYMSLAAQAALLHDFLRRIHARRPVLVGHSWGAILALVYALRYPGDVSALVLLAPAAYPYPETPWFRLLRRPVVGTVLRDAVFLPLTRHLAGAAAARAYAPNPVPGRAERLASTLALRPSDVLATAEDDAAASRELGRYVPRYASIRVPVVIAQGDGDLVVDDAERLHDAIPGSVLMRLPETGHEIPEARPDVAATAVEKAWRMRSAPPAIAGGQDPRRPRARRACAVCAIVYYTCMEHRLSATDLARNAGDILGRIRYRGESFVIERNGEPVARIGPLGTRPAALASLARAWAEATADSLFAADLERVAAEDRAAERAWDS